MHDLQPRVVTDDARDVISWRFPDEDKAIKNGAALIVRESQVAQFVYLGEFGDTFGPGKHSLVTDNIPILTRLRSWKYGFESPFKADVYFINTRLFTGNKWGTMNPIMMRDPEFYRECLAAAYAESGRVGPDILAAAGGMVEED